MIPLQMAHQMVKDSCDLTLEEVADLRQRCSAENLTPELAAYVKANSEGKPRRRGRPRARTPGIEFHRRVDALTDYHLVLYDEQVNERRRKSSYRVRRRRLPDDETPKERALDRVKEKHGLVPSPRRIENLLCEWWKDSTVRRCALREIRRGIECAERH